MANSLEALDILKVRIWTRTVDLIQAAVNTIYYQVTSIGATAPTDLDAATFLDGQWTTAFHACLSSLAEYRGVQCQILNNTPPYTAKFAAAQFNGSAGVGTAAANLVPLQAAGLITYYTPFAGAKGKGRTYVPFGPASDLAANGKWSTTYVGLITTLASKLSVNYTVTAGSSSAVIQRVLVHRNPKVGPPLPPSAITSVAVTTNVATQKRRGNFGRPNTSPI